MTQYVNEFHDRSVAAHDWFIGRLIWLNEQPWTCGKVCDTAFHKLCLKSNINNASVGTTKFCVENNVTDLHAYDHTKKELEILECFMIEHTNTPWEQLLTVR